MIRKKQYLAWSGLATLALMLGACDDDGTKEVYIGDLYQMAYVTTGISAPDDFVMCTADPLYVGGVLKVDDDRCVVTDETGQFSTDQGTEVDIFVCTTYPAKTAISGTVCVLPDAEAFIEEYNRAHGLLPVAADDADAEGEEEAEPVEDNRWKLLPEGCYALSENHVTIPAGKKEVKVVLSMATDTEWTKGNWMLPLTFVPDADSPVKVSEKVLACPKFEIKSVNKAFENSRMLAADECTNSNSNLEAAFDGKNSTQTASNSQSVDISLNTPQPLKGIVFANTTGYAMNSPYYQSKVAVKWEGSETWTANFNVPLTSSSSSGFSKVTVENVICDVTQLPDYEEGKKVSAVRLTNGSWNIGEFYILVANK